MIKLADSRFNLSFTCIFFRKSMLGSRLKKEKVINYRPLLTIPWSRSEWASGNLEDFIFFPFLSVGLMVHASFVAG